MIVYCLISANSCILMYYRDVVCCVHLQGRLVLMYPQDHELSWCKHKFPVERLYPAARYNIPVSRVRDHHSENLKLEKRMMERAVLP